MPSEAALLRDDNAQLHVENMRLCALVTSTMEVWSAALTAECEKTRQANERADRLQEEVAGLQKRLKITQSWNGRPSENPEYAKSRSEFRNQVA